MSILMIETEVCVDLGIVGDVDLPIVVDVADHYNSCDLAEHVAIVDYIDYHGTEDVLNNIAFNDIVKFCMEHQGVLALVIEALEEKYAND